MKPTIPGLSSAAAGFDAPLAMLATCHERGERQCATLLRLAAHLRDHGADAQASEAATAVMRYFDRASPDHHADEEADLFPALIDSLAGSDAVCLNELTRSLTADHRELEALWQALRAPLQRIAAGEPVSLDAGSVQALVDGYLQHSAREDAELLPLAARLLDDAALQRMGRAMRTRRGIADGA
jgi:hemerythrin-like domain-containing protein